MEVRSTCLLLAAVAALSAQSPEPTKVIATINGRPVTAREYEQMLAAMTPDVRAAARNQPAQVLEQYALYETILAEAEKAKLDEQSPYREQIAEARRHILVQGQIASRQAGLNIAPAEIEKAYERNRARWTQAKVKVIFLSRMATSQTLDDTKKEVRTPDQSQKLAGDLVARLKGGEDFVEVAKKYSDDNLAASGADFPDVVRPTSAAIPADIRDAILVARTGDILGPFEQESGFYLFRVESSGTAPLADVKEQITKELRDTAMREWLEAAKARSTVKIEPGVFISEKQ